MLHTDLSMSRAMRLLVSTQTSKSRLATLRKAESPEPFAQRPIPLMLPELNLIMTRDLIWLKLHIKQSQSPRTMKQARCVSCQFPSVFWWHQSLMGRLKCMESQKALPPQIIYFWHTCGDWSKSGNGTSVTYNYMILRLVLTLWEVH